MFQNVTKAAAWLWRCPIVLLTGGDAFLRFPSMAIINHSVEQLTGPGYWTKFEGLERVRLTITVPNWHEPFPSQQRAGSPNPRSLELVGLLHVCQSWYFNGPVVDQWTISTLSGPIKVPAGTRIVSEPLPEKWAAWEQEASEGTKQWWAYSNGRTAFC